MLYHHFNSPFFFFSLNLQCLLYTLLFQLTICCFLNIVLQFNRHRSFILFLLCFLLSNGLFHFFNLPLNHQHFCFIFAFSKLFIHFFFLFDPSFEFLKSICQIIEIRFNFDLFFLHYFDIAIVEIDNRILPSHLIIL